MGEVAEMMMDGVLCIRCGTAFGGKSFPGHPRACRDCQRDENVDQYGNPKGPGAATPHKQLIAELDDATIPKTEREHAASREIWDLREKLRHLQDHHGRVVANLEAVESEIRDCRRKLEDYTNFDEVIAVACRLEELEKRLEATQ